MTRIAFLGAGNMAGALIEGLLSSGAAAPADVVATDVRSERLTELAERGIGTESDNAAAVRSADVIVLAVKPQVLPAVLAEVESAAHPDALFVSVAAGVPTARIEAALGEGVRVVRAMPNTPALVGEGATAISAGTHATDADLEAARSLFDTVGKTVTLPEELIDAVTGLSGSGPAYVFLMVEALVDAGVECGLDRDAAHALATQTVLGAARLMTETGEAPAALREKVTSPGGTTLAGLTVLEKGGFRDLVARAVEAATARSKELGRGER